jgi:hypothetical protein
MAKVVEEVAVEDRSTLSVPSLTLRLGTLLALL